MTEETLLLSRRNFLQMAGIAAVSSRFLAFKAFLNAATTLVGRPFEALPVRSARRADAPVVSHLWPDSIVPILDADGDWYAIPGGYVPRGRMQPMFPYQPQTDIPMPDRSFWAEVAAPAATVREYAAADAPLVTRVGHGGILKVVDALPNRDGSADWYAASETDGDILGWTQAVRWRPVADTTHVSTNEPTLSIDLQSRRLTLLQANRVLLSAPLSMGINLQPGTYTVSERQIGGGRFGGYHGLPWQIRLNNGYDIAGIYWHNDFGAPAPGPAIQLPPMVAASLYPWLDTGAKVSIR
jgi:hypothetical protein